MRSVVFVAALFVVPVPAAHASPQALSLSDVSDDARATIAKELARKNRQQKASGGDASEDESDPRGARSTGGCNMDVGSQNQRSPASRRTVTVITGSVVQICK